MGHREGTPRGGVRGVDECTELEHVPLVPRLDVEGVTRWV